MKPHSAIARISLAAAAILIAMAQHGCRDAPTAPADPPALLPSSAINAPGDSTAPEIVFLAPLGPKLHPHGVLDTTLSPSVAICRLTDDDCGAADTLAHFTSDSAADSTIRVLRREHAYHVRWKVKDLPADSSVAYRVVVTLGDTTVGSTDFKLVPANYTPPAADTARFGFVPERKRLNIRFQIFMPPVTLTVLAEPGVHGNLTSQTYTYRRGERVPYDFTADSGYTNALVTLDENPIPKRGHIRMDDSHILIASADRATGVAAGDKWILHEARSLLRAGNKVAAAQKLLDKLDAMTDTTDIIDRLRHVEMTVLARDADAAAMPALDAALAGHSFEAGAGIGARDAVPPPGGGGGGGGGGHPVASARLAPLGGTALHPAASTSINTVVGAEPVTIVYVNGILTTPLGALFAAHHVAMVAREAHWNSNAPFHVKLMYNRSAMADRTSKEDQCVLDLGIKGDWLGLNSLPAEVAKCIKTTRPRAMALLEDYAEVTQEFASVLDRSIATRPADVDSIAAFTTRLRDDGEHVVFVMHSQGNLVVQQALTLLARSGKYSQAQDTTCIGGVALAAPTSEAWPIAARHLHGLVVDGDAILLLGHNRFPRIHTPLSDSAANATTGSLRTRIVALATGETLRWRVRLHGMIESYLTQQPMRDSIAHAMVSAYRGCALGTVAVTPQILQLHTGDVGSLHASLLDLDGDPIDGKRGLEWATESQIDAQRAAVVSQNGTVTARYVGGTQVNALTRNITGTAGIAVDPAQVHVAATETLSAVWSLVFPPSIPDEGPIPEFIIPATSWDGTSCSEQAILRSNGRVTTGSKQCTAAYQVTLDPFPDASQYTATFFARNSTAPAFMKSDSRPSIHGVVSGPEANLEHLPGPTVIDRIGVTVFDGAGHLLASGNACVHGCIGWPPGI